MTTFATPDISNGRIVPTNIYNHEKYEFYIFMATSYGSFQHTALCTLTVGCPYGNADVTFTLSGSNTPSVL